MKISPFPVGTRPLVAAPAESEQDGDLEDLEDLEEPGVMSKKIGEL